MICPEYFFNPLKDEHPVEQTGYIDMVQAFNSGSVPSNLEGTDEDYNGMDSPDMILGKPDDIFEAYRMKEFIDSYSKDVGSSDSNKSDSASS